MSTYCIEPRRLGKGMGWTVRRSDAKHYNRWGIIRYRDSAIRLTFSLRGVDEIIVYDKNFFLEFRWCKEVL